MRDQGGFPTESGRANVQFFVGNNITAGAGWQVWRKPKGMARCSMLLIGKGANGGAGAIGLNSTAAAGGGGGSGGQTEITMPMSAVPNILYIQLPGVGSASAAIAYVAAQLNNAANTVPVANSIFCQANGGAVGGNAAGATAGAAGAGAAIATAANMPLGSQWASFTAGQAGIIGGAAVAGGNLTVPATSLRVTGGAGGGGLPATAVAGVAGGGITGAGILPSMAGGLLTAVATTPGGPGQSGYRPVQDFIYFLGGTGGASTHGSATGGGLVQADGGDGQFGCGGGGSGGALTGSAAGRVGLGGAAWLQISCW